MATAVSAAPSASADVLPIDASVEQESFDLDMAIQQEKERYGQALRETTFAINDSRVKKGPITKGDFEIAKRGAVANLSH